MAGSVSPGTVLYLSEDDWYIVYKVLEASDDNSCFVRCYWPSPELPDAANWQLNDVRTSCEEMQLPDTITIIATDPVTAEDREAVANFRRIQAGIRKRKTQWAVLLSEAETLTEQANWEEVIVCCTECASYVKYEARVFQLRGHALLQLDRFSEAIADLEHALSIQPNDANTLYDCALAYAKSGKTDAAREKMLALEQNHPEDARLLIVRALL